MDCHESWDELRANETGILYRMVKSIKGRSFNSEREREREREREGGVEFEPCIPSGEPHDAAAFPRLNIWPKCRCFVYVREIKQNVTGLQPYCTRTFNRCYQPNSWNTYIYTERQYLKGSYNKTEMH